MVGLAVLARLRSILDSGDGMKSQLPRAAFAADSVGHREYHTGLVPHGADL